MEVWNENWKIALISLLISPMVSKMIKSISNAHVEISFVLVAPILFFVLFRFQKKKSN